MPVIELTIDSRGSVTGMKKFDDSVSNSENKTISSFDKIKRAAIKLGAAIVAMKAGQALIDIGTSSIRAASDMEEVQNKFDVVFRDIGTYAEDSAKVVADSYLMSTRETKQYMSSIQDLIVPSGMARDEAAKMSVEFTKLAADLGSFNNMKTEVVIRDITSALAGGSETMTKYGINVKVAAVNAYVLENGLDVSTEAAKRQSRTTALLAIMQRDSADAIGDVSRSTNSYANQSKLLTANLEDMRGELGEKLLPIASKFLGILNEWITKGNVVSTVMLWIVKVTRFVHDGFAGLILIGKGIVVAFAEVFDFMLKGLKQMLWPIDALFDALVMVGALDFNPFDEAIQASETFKESSKDVFNDHVKYIDESAAAFNRLEAEIASTNEEQEKTKTLVDEINALVGTTNTEHEKEKVLVKDVNGLLNEKKEILDKTKEANDKILQDTKDIKEEKKEEVDLTDKIEKSLKESVDHVEGLAAGFTAVTAEAEKAAEAVGKVAEMTKDASGSASSLSDDMGGYNSGGSTSTMSSKLPDDFANWDKLLQDQWLAADSNRSSYFYFNDGPGRFEGPTQESIQNEKDLIEAFAGGSSGINIYISEKFSRSDINAILEEANRTAGRT